MRKSLLTICLLTLLAGLTWSLPADKDRDREAEAWSLLKSNGVEDRAGGTHNAGNIGLFFENRGKLYPRRLTQGPSGEFPIGSGKNYVYRINPMVAVPGNVIQGRYTTNEEWEAVGGYHNRSYAKVAFSDNPLSWDPALGWPVKDSNGNPIVKSDQDSYCVYDDHNNSVRPLGVVVEQTGYAYGVKFAQNLLFFKFKIKNEGNKDLDSLYFSMYCDIDVGDVSGGAPEYQDDRLDFDKANNFLYFFDDGASSEWAGNVTGFFGVTILKTPTVNGVEPGITDWHYNLYDDDRDDDSLQYAILSSNPRIIRPQTLVEKYFHTGANPGLHFDDPATIPASGLDLTATLSSGPYQLKRGDSLVFYTAMVAGNNKEELYNYLKTAQKILQFNFEISKPPATPILSASAGDGQVTLYWDDAAERSRDNYSGEYDFEGYRIYKSVDKGLHWDQWDRNVDPSVGIDPVPIAKFDLVNNIGLDLGLQHSFTDTNVKNGFEYWYTITAYDRGDASVESLESPRGNSPDALNTETVTPKAAPINRTPVTSFPVQHTRGNSNYVLTVQPVDQDSLADREYVVRFTYSQQTSKGTLKTRITPTIVDSTKTEAKHVGIEFAAANSLHLIDLSTGDYIGSDPRSYKTGTTYSINKGLRIKVEDPDPLAAAQFLPKAGDYLTLYYSVYVQNNKGKTVVPVQPMNFYKPCATSDGVVFTLKPPDLIQSVSRIGGTDIFNMTFTVIDEAAVKTGHYEIATTQKGVVDGKGFISLLIKSTGGEVKADTLFSGGTFEFDGISCTITFNASAPPAPGNILGVETMVAVPPTIQDSYRIKIKGAEVQNVKAANELERIRVVPNPYMVASLYEPEFGELRKEPVRQIQFINLPQECTIYIFTVAGDLVKTIKHQAANGSEQWDLRAEGGREIASGVYLYIVKTNDAQYKSTFAVIK